jgi:energy-coupling factor transporter ATP-binding protein EcfA2
MREALSDVELVGLPGSGKSTIFKALRSAIEAEGFVCRTPNDILGEPIPKGSTVRFVRRRPDRELLFRYLEFYKRHPEFRATVDRVLSTSSSTKDEFLFSWMVANYQGYVARHEPGKAFLMDEGFIHRGIQLFMRNGNADDFPAYFGTVPVPQVAVVVEVLPETGYQRRVGMFEGAELENKLSKYGGLDAFRQRLELQTRAIDAIEERGTAVFRVSGEEGGRADWDRVSRAVAQELKAQAAEEVG